MRAFLFFFALFASARATSTLSNDDGSFVPFQIQLAWTNTKSSLRATCTKDEIESIDTLLSLHLGEHMVGVKGYIKQGEIIPHDKLIPCKDQTCEASYEIPSSKVAHFTHARLSHIQNHLASVCTSMLIDVSKDTQLYGSACRRSLAGATCQGSMAVTSF